MVDRDFRRLWTGQSVSLLGSQITTFAVPVFAIGTLGAGPGELSLLRTAEFLPFLFLTLPAGAWVDRHPARPAMIAANALRGLLITLIAAAGWAGLLHLGTLAVALLAIGAATVVFDVAHVSYLPAVVGRAGLVHGNSRLAVSSAVADVAGPGLAGVLVQLLTAPVTLLVDAVSYLVSVVTLTRIRTPDPAPAPGRGRVLGGLPVVARNPYLRVIGLESFAYNFFVQFGETLITLYALTELGLSAGLLGLCIGVGSLGGLAGAAVAPRVIRRAGFGPAFVAGTALGCAAPVLVPLAVPGSPAAAVLLIAAAYLLTGFGVTISVIGSVTLRQTVAPPELLGRVTAVMRLASYAAVPLGTLATGAVASLAGVRAGLFAGAAGLLLPVLILLASPVPRLRAPDDATTGRAAAV